MMILICHYMVLFFTGGLTNDPSLIYQIGWYMDILLMFLFSVNIVCILYNILIYLKTAIHRVRVYLVRLRLRALKEQREREE